MNKMNKINWCKFVYNKFGPRQIRKYATVNFNRVLTKQFQVVYKVDCYFLNKSRVCGFFCTTPDKDKALERTHSKVTSEIKHYYEEKRERLRDTEQRLKYKGSIILKDIKETKEKVKERVEEIIEVNC